MKKLENYRSFDMFLNDFFQENDFKVDLSGNIISHSSKQELINKALIMHNRLVESHIFYNSPCLLKKELARLSEIVLDDSTSLEDKQEVSSIIKELKSRLASSTLSTLYTCKFCEKEVSIEIDLLIKKKVEARKAQILESIKFDSSKREIVELFKIFGIDDMIQVRVLMQWMANVKRYLMNKDVEWNLFPILVSPVQGCGKTHLVNTLCSIFKNGDCFEGVVNKKFSYLLNQFNLSNIYSNYVIFLDEMVMPSKKDDLNELKRLVDAKEDYIREVYQKNPTLFKRHFSFIGTSNFGIEDTLKEDSSNRRFVQIDIKRKENSRKEFDSINPFDLWKCIDENETYVSETEIEQIRQSKLESDKENNPVDVFLSEREISNIENNIVLLSELFSDFDNFCKMEKIATKLNRITFGNELKARNFKVGRFNLKEGQQLYVKCSL